MSEALRVLQYLEEKCGMKSDKLHAGKCEKCRKGCKCEDEDDGITRYEDPEDDDEYEGGDEEDDMDEGRRRVGGRYVRYRDGKREVRGGKYELTGQERQKARMRARKAARTRKMRGVRPATRLKRARTLRIRKARGGR
jgi:hypothetical protein